MEIVKWWTGLAIMLGQKISRRGEKMVTKKKIGLSIFIALFLLSGIGAGPVAGKELKLILADYLPPSYDDYFPANQIFVDYVNKHGRGIVQIDFFHSGKLLQAKELMPGLLQGTADIIVDTDSYVMGTAPILGILELPFLYKDEFDFSKKTRIGTPLFNLINQELAKQNLIILSSCASTPEHIWSVKKPIKRVEDLKGLRIRTAGRVEAEVIKALGAASTTLPSAEVYEALKRGTIDASLHYLGTVPGRSLQEVYKFVTLGYWASYGRQPYMRLDRWKALPQEIKDVLIAAGKAMEDEGFKTLVKVHNEKYWPLVRKAGIQIIEPAPEEAKRFKEACLPVWDWWKKQVPADVAAKAIELATK
ncbi:MAG: TRAP transporter substrate-binding protein [Deltaproteobacteria bacterium]|nr:TRAP transporter substrate-binding protein [Deltaproteobacteria bacterium]